MPDAVSLRHEFRVSTGRNPRKSIENPPLRHFACILRHNITFFPVETRNSSLSEAASGTTFQGRHAKKFVGQAKMLGEMTIEVPKAPSFETPQVSREGGLGRGCTPPQSIRGSGERRKLSQRGPGWSLGSLRIFYVSGSILCLKLEFNSQFYIILGTDKSISLISNQFTGSKSHKANNAKFFH